MTEETAKPRIVLISVQKDLDALGLKILHYSLLDAGVDSRLLFLPGDLSSASARERVIEFVVETSPHLVGFSLMSHEHGRAELLTKTLRSSGQDVPVIWGGIHPTIESEACADIADWVCVGEGERSLRELLSALNANDGARTKEIPNLVWKEDGDLKRNPPAPLERDLDRLPIVDHVPEQSYMLHRDRIQPLSQTLFRQHSRYQGSMYSLVSSRGCPFACTYCCNNALSQIYNTRKVRHRSVENIIGELERAIESNPYLEYINIQDDCFLSRNEAAIADFAVQYRTRVAKPFVVRCIPTFLTREKMSSLKDAGLAWMMLGLQSGSDRVNRDVYRRGSKRADFLRAAQLVREFRVAAYYDIIMDNPFENEDDQLETIETLLSTPRPYYPQFFSLTFYPGSELFDRAQAEKPEALEDCREKDYTAYRQTPINALTRLAGYLDRPIVEPLLRLYKQAPNSLRFRMALRAAKLYSAIAIEPLTYFRVIRDSQGGSTTDTIRVLPYYFREGLLRYFKQYGSSS